MKHPNDQNKPQHLQDLQAAYDSAAGLAKSLRIIAEHATARADAADGDVANLRHRRDEVLTHYLATMPAQLAWTNTGIVTNHGHEIALISPRHFFKRGTHHIKKHRYIIRARGHSPLANAIATNQRAKKFFDSQGDAIELIKRIADALGVQR